MREKKVSSGLPGIVQASMNAMCPTCWMDVLNTPITPTVSVKLSGQATLCMPAFMHAQENSCTHKTSTGSGWTSQIKEEEYLPTLLQERSYPPPPSLPKKKKEKEKANR